MRHLKHTLGIGFVACWAAFTAAACAGIDESAPSSQEEIDQSGESLQAHTTCSCVAVVCHEEHGDRVANPCSADCSGSEQANCICGGCGPVGNRCACGIIQL
jgi:hypothetical protein